MRRSRFDTLSAGQPTGGFSLLELMVSAFLLLVVFFALATTYWRGQVQLGYEENRRKATAVAQARLDGIRHSVDYDAMPDLAGVDTMYTVEGHNYRVSHQVTADSLANAIRVKVTVFWTERISGEDRTRSHETTTIFARALPWGS